MIDKKIFDAEKVYGTTTGSYFLNGNPGLFDSINKFAPVVWERYKKLKTLDWDENEQIYQECQVEFESGDPSEIRKMIATLSWQWEQDSIAAHHIVPLYAPFAPCSEVWAALCRIQDNEVLHGLTYSEIVKNSFKNYQEVMSNVLADLEPLKRLKAVGEALHHVQQVGAKMTLGLISMDSDEARDAVMLLTFTMFCMERVQFMGSFAVTFALGDVGKFVPIAKIVQKICNDEFNIHAEVGRAIIRNELSTEVGRASWARIRDRVAAIWREVIQGEINFTRDYLFADGKELFGLNADLLVQFTLWCATDVYNETDLENPFGNVVKNPLGYMEDWVELDKNQAAAQEEKTVNYLLGGTEDDVQGKVFSIEGI